MSSRTPDIWWYDPDKLDQQRQTMYRYKLMAEGESHVPPSPASCSGPELGTDRNTLSWWEQEEVGPYLFGAANYCTASLASSFHPKWGGSVWFKLTSARAAAENRYGVCSPLHLQPHIPAYASTRAPETRQSVGWGSQSSWKLIYRLIFFFFVRLGFISTEVLVLAQKRWWELSGGQNRTAFSSSSLH